MDLRHPTNRPTVAILQWRNEIEAHTEGFKVYNFRSSLRLPVSSFVDQVAVWHGASREKSHRDLAKNDIILTTVRIHLLHTVHSY